MLFNIVYIDSMTLGLVGRNKEREIVAATYVTTAYELYVLMKHWHDSNITPEIGEITPSGDGEVFEMANKKRSNE